MQGRCSDIRGSQGPLPAGYEASEGIAVTVLLTLAGGLQDAYSYFARGHVFANAQTGNIVLLAAALLEGDWSRAFSYIIPLLSFAGGIYAALEIRRLYRGAGRIHWRQIVAFCEILLLAAVGCMGEGHSQIANAMASFSCAMQVEAFRHVRGNAYASTMCIGNIRALMENLHSLAGGDRAAGGKALHYLGVLIVFAIGAALGAFLLPYMGLRAIWAGALLIAAASIIMARRKR